MKIVKAERQGMPTYPNEAGGPNAVEILCVLTRGDCGRYAAYVAAIPLSTKTEDAAGWVALHGRKVEYRHLGQYFRGLTEAEYRA